MRRLAAFLISLVLASSSTAALADESADDSSMDGGECPTCALDAAESTLSPDDGVLRPPPDASDPAAVKAQSSSCATGRSSNGSWIGVLGLLFLLRRRRSSARA